MNNNRLLAAAAVAAMMLGTATASNASDNEHCTNEPIATWHSPGDAIAAAESLGYKEVARIDIEGTCYEAYARDKDGRRVEIQMDPVALKIVRVKNK